MTGGGERQRRADGGDERVWEVLRGSVGIQTACAQAEPSAQQPQRQRAQAGDGGWDTSPSPAAPRCAQPQPAEGPEEITSSISWFKWSQMSSIVKEDSFRRVT